MLDKDVYRQVSNLHVVGIPQGFLSGLGPHFLSLLYQAIDESQDGVLLVETEGARVVGFIAGGSGMTPIYRQLLKRLPQLLLALLPIAIAPSKFVGIFDILVRSGRGKKGSDAAGLPEYELFSIVVAPDFRGRGIAEKLYVRLCRYFAEQHVSEFKILVGRDLAHANRFYRRMGAEVRLEKELHKGTTSNVYVQQIPEVK